MQTETGNHARTAENVQHTPGTWTPTNDGEANFSGIAVPGRWLMRIQQNGELSTAEQEANTRAIAAIPAFAHACRLLKAAYDRGEESQSVDWDDVDAAYTAALEALAMAGEIPPESAHPES